MLEGVYRWPSFLFDALCGCCIFGILQAGDHALSTGLKRLFGDKQKLSRAFVAGIRLVTVILVFGTFLLATVQMHLPKIGCAKSPADFGIEFTEHMVATDDGIKIVLWAMPADESDRPVVVVTHGLGANKQNFMFVSELIHRLNYNVVAFDFRGHGDSGGHTCTLGVNEAADVKAAYDFAVEYFPDRKIFAWSTSLGAAATVRAAAEYQIFDKLIVDATFASIKDVAMETKFCYLGPFDSTAWQISRLWYRIFTGKDIEEFGPINDIGKIESPILLIHGTHDPVIPHSESDKLLAAAKQGTELWKVVGAGHSGSFHHPGYSKRIVTFFDEAGESN